MSWGIFKSNMKGYMSNPIGVASLQVFAKKLTVEYDMCITCSCRENKEQWY